jgi:hypothetical protein
MVHYYHNDIKIYRLSSVFGLNNLLKSHRIAANYAKNLIINLILDYDNNIKEVNNSYW